MKVGLLALLWSLISACIMLFLWFVPVIAGELAQPSPILTPGVIVEGMTAKKSCATQWGKDVRHVTSAMKQQMCFEYAARKCPGPQWELDHWIPRELGGADDVRNLWPQPLAEARQKDRVENYLHRRVCAGTMTLEQAQRMVRDWPAVLQEITP